MSKSTSFFLAIGILIADQVSKWLVVTHISYGSGFFVSDHLNLIHVRNEGALFGFLSDQAGWQNTFFLMLSVVVLLGLGYWIRTTIAADRQQLIGLYSVLGGACGNMIDRINHGAVIDFIDIHAFGWHWPAFNVADSAIVCGVILLLLCHLNMRIIPSRKIH